MNGRGIIWRGYMMISISVADGRIFSGSNGKNHDNLCSLTHFAFDANAPAKTSHQVFGDRQTQSCALLDLRLGVRCAVKFFEQTCLGFVGDTDPRVNNFEMRIPFNTVQRYGYSPAIGSLLDCIGYEVIEDSIDLLVCSGYDER